MNDTDTLNTIHEKPKTSTKTNQEQKTSCNSYTIIICCIILYGLSNYLRNSRQPLIKSIFPQLGFTNQQTATIQSAFFYSYAPLMIPIGLFLPKVSSELALIIPLILSGVSAQLVYFARSYNAFVAIGILTGLSQSTCWLAILSIIQQQFSLDSVSLWIGLAQMVGNAAPIACLFLAYLIEEHKIWREPFVYLGFLMQFVCVILFICYVIDRKAIIQTPGWKNWFISRDDLMEIDEKKTDLIEIGTSKYPFLKKMFAALANPYNYLLTVCSFIAIPHVIIPATWLTKYLTLKFDVESTTHAVKINSHYAQIIFAVECVGAASGSFLFGFIGKRCGKKYKYLNRMLCCIGFILSSSILFMIYIPAAYHSSYSLLCVFAFIHGSALGVTTIVFSAIRQVNDVHKCADFASSMVSTFGVIAVSVSHTIIGKLMQRYGESLKVEEYNQVFYFVVAIQVVGRIASCFVPKNF